MTLVLREASPFEARALLEESHALMQALFPADANHALSLDDLRAPHIHFIIATKANSPVGCAALAHMKTYGELKSMFVSPTARGSGAGTKLLAAIETHARNIGLPLLRLETGTTLHNAQGLYTRHGYTPRGPFGDYPDHRFSLFMEKRLT